MSLFWVLLQLTVTDVVSGDNWTKLQSNHCHQQTNTKVLQARCPAYHLVNSVSALKVKEPYITASSSSDCSSSTVAVVVVVVVVFVFVVFVVVVFVVVVVVIVVVLVVVVVVLVMIDSAVCVVVIVQYNRTPINMPDTTNM